MKTITAFRKLSIIVTLAATTALVNLYLWTVEQDTLKMMDMVLAWKAAGPHTTVMGRLREHLAAAWWLGPLQLATPRDPLGECGVSDGGDWWQKVALVAGIRQPVACLERQVRLAFQEHDDFVTNFRVTVCGLVLLLACGAFLLRRRWRRLRPTCKLVLEEANDLPAQPDTPEQEAAPECAAHPEESLQEASLPVEDNVSPPNVHDRDGAAACTKCDDVHDHEKQGQKDGNAACTQRNNVHEDKDDNQKDGAVTCTASDIVHEDDDDNQKDEVNACTPTDSVHEEEKEHQKDEAAACTASDSVHEDEKVHQNDEAATCSPCEDVRQAEPQRQAPAESHHAQKMDVGQAGPQEVAPAEPRGAQAVDAPSDVAENEAHRLLRRTLHLPPRYTERLLGTEAGFVEAWRGRFGVLLFHDPLRKRIHIKGGKSSVEAVCKTIRALLAEWRRQDVHDDYDNQRDVETACTSCDGVHENEDDNKKQEAAACTSSDNVHENEKEDNKNEAAACTSSDNVHEDKKVEQNHEAATCSPCEDVRQAEPQRQAPAESHHAQEVDVGQAGPQEVAPAEPRGAQAVDAPSDVAENEAHRLLRRTLHLPPRYTERLLGTEAGFVEAWRGRFGVLIIHDPLKKRLHIKGGKSSVEAVSKTVRALLAEWRRRDAADE